MKKVISFVLVVMLLVSIVPTAFATNATANTTTLTTNVPDAIYTLNIPADQPVDYGSPSKNIGNVSVTGGMYFTKGKNLEVTVAYNSFTCPDVETTIPFKLVKYYKSPEFTKKIDITNNDVLIFKGLSSTAETCIEQFSQISGTNAQGNPVSVDMQGIELVIDSADWGKALAGDYTATITFTAAVVVEE